jgi:hypothetical protein
VTVFAPFPRRRAMIGPPEHSWMINFRVDDLDAIVTQLRTAGETVDVDPERYPNGLFAELSDPEGNRVRLWQPLCPDGSGRERTPDSRTRRSSDAGARGWTVDTSARTCKGRPAGMTAHARGERSRRGCA